eukprot:364378-Chlamydomonas_euryale.AAC.12
MAVMGQTCINSLHLAAASIKHAQHRGMASIKASACAAQEGLSVLSTGGWHLARHQRAQHRRMHLSMYQRAQHRGMASINVSACSAHEDGTQRTLPPPVGPPRRTHAAGWAPGMRTCAVVCRFACMYKHACTNCPAGFHAVCMGPDMGWQLHKCMQMHGGMQMARPSFMEGRGVQARVPSQVRQRRATLTPTCDFASGHRRGHGRQQFWPHNFGDNASRFGRLCFSTSQPRMVPRDVGRGPAPGRSPAEVERSPPFPSLSLSTNLDGPATHMHTIKPPGSRLPGRECPNCRFSTPQNLDDPATRMGTIQPPGR